VSEINQIDMLRDEFLRIKANAGCTAEIDGICVRALSDIKRRFPVVEENERRLTKLREARNLLEDISSWMVENDYECGDEGSEIFDRIASVLKTAEKS